MASINARVSSFVMCLVAAVLFQLTRASITSVAFVSDVLILAVAGVVLVEIIRFLAKAWTPRTLLIGLFALIVGFGAATFIVLCSQILFGLQAFPQMFDPLLRFLLPLSATLAAYSGLQTLSIAKRSDSESEDSTEGGERTRTYIPDLAALEDGRILDLARTGLFDNQLILPSFLATDLRFLSETGEESSRIRAKKALDALRKLESLPKLNARIRDFHITEELELSEKLLKCAKRSHSLIMTNENAPLRQDADQYFAIDSIANALRPPIPKGEMLSIKIQRLGKEPKQGIGYLDDGTMVVVNGGGDFLGRSVRTQVLSQKYSSSGKIVFCNVREEDLYDDRSGNFAVPFPQIETTSFTPYSS